MWRKTFQSCEETFRAEFKSLQRAEKQRHYSIPLRFKTYLLAETYLVPAVGISIVPMFIRTSSPKTKQLFDAILVNETMEEVEKFSSMEKLAQKLLNPVQVSFLAKVYAAAETVTCFVKLSRCM